MKLRQLARRLPGPVLNLLRAARLVLEEAGDMAIYFVFYDLQYVE